MASPTEREAIAVLLKHLLDERQEIDRTIHFLKSRLSGESKVPPLSEQLRASPERAPAPDAFRGLSIAEAAKRVLGEAGRPLGNAAIAQELIAGGLEMRTVDPPNTVGSILARASKNDPDIVRVSRGIWGLRSWPAERLFDVRIGKIAYA